EKLTDITTAIDKLDKIGIEKVKAELITRGLSETQVASVVQYLAIDGSNEEKLARMSELLGQIENGRKGLEEIMTVLSFSHAQDDKAEIIYDPTLARGLNYYT